MQNNFVIRDGQLFIDNSSVNLSNRLNDAAPITTRGRNQIEMMANGEMQKIYDDNVKLAIDQIVND